MLKEHIQFYKDNKYIFSTADGQVYHITDIMSSKEEKDYDTLTFLYPCAFDSYEYTEKDKAEFVRKMLIKFPFLKRVAKKYKII